jgi:anti-sigma regulatory factor (Ser/Thr protein kinase)
MRPPTPADSGGLPGSPVVAGSSRSSSASGGTAAPATLLAAPVAEALAILPDESARLFGDGLSSGGCFARPLPIDSTCAAAARRYFREAVSSLTLPSGLLHDGVTMASELAANTLHAQRNAARGQVRHTGAAGIPEIWLYLRGTGRTRELVCKVFDTERGWNAGSAPGMTKAPVDSVSGRGLQVVAGLSAGQWGCHLTRSRLGNWKVPGKAVWFALRIPPSALPDHYGRPRYSPEALTDELEAMLADRGLAGGIVRADSDHLSVLSLSQHLTVWRLAEVVSWRAPSGSYQQHEIADLVDVAEHIVCAHEEAAYPGPPQRP